MNISTGKKLDIKMDDNFEHPVYSANVIEFVTVSREFCNWLEGTQEQERKRFVNTALKILPLLYLKATMLPKPELVLEDVLEKSVSEHEYEFVRSSVQIKMGLFDEYLEVFTADMQRSELPLTSTISENMADIYQDIKDFLFSYRTAVTEIMNDALAELVSQFEMYWGQRLVNVLRALHQVNYSGESLDEEDSDYEDETDSDDWKISNRQNDWQNDLFKKGM
jgi:hypothetical protein